MHTFTSFDEVAHHWLPGVSHVNFGVVVKGVFRGWGEARKPLNNLGRAAEMLERRKVH